MARIAVSFMDRKSCADLIRELAECYKFDFCEDGNGWIPCVRGDNVRFSFEVGKIEEEPLKSGSFRYTIRANAIVRGVDGCPSVKELRNVASQIKRAADFVNDFNSKRIKINEDMKPYRPEGGK